MTLRDLVAKIGADPSLKSFQARELEDLLCFYLGMSWSDLHVQKDRPVNSEENQVIDDALTVLKTGVPLAYIIGERFFYKSNFYVNSDVLIPRPETELLVELGLQVIGKQPAVVMDLGAGSGCIGLSIAQENPQSEVWLIDSEPGPMEVVKINTERLGLINVRLQKGQVGTSEFSLPQLISTVDLIVANPPYIAEGDPRVEKRVHQFEPHSALYAPNNGLKWIHKWLEWGYHYLKPGGSFIFEFGQGQDEDIQKFLKNTFYKESEFVKDYSNIVRFCKLQK